MAIAIGKIIGDIFGKAGGEILSGAKDILDEASFSKEERQEKLLEWERLANEKLARAMESSNELEKAFLEDTADARKMQAVALQQDDAFSKRFLYYFITAWSLFSMAFLVGVTFFYIPTTSVRFADTILGFLLGTAIASVFSFMVGSSRGSSSKEKALIHIAKAQGSGTGTGGDTSAPTL